MGRAVKRRSVSRVTWAIVAANVVGVLYALSNFLYIAVRLRLLPFVIEPGRTGADLAPANNAFVTVFFCLVPIAAILPGYACWGKPGPRISQVILIPLFLLLWTVIGDRERISIWSSVLHNASQMAVLYAIATAISVMVSFGVQFLIEAIKRRLRRIEK